MKKLGLWATVSVVGMASFFGGCAGEEASEISTVLGNDTPGEMGSASVGLSVFDRDQNAASFRVEDPFSYIWMEKQSDIFATPSIITGDQVLLFATNADMFGNNAEQSNRSWGLAFGPNAQGALTTYVVIRDNGVTHPPQPISRDVISEIMISFPADEQKIIGELEYWNNPLGYHMGIAEQTLLVAYYKKLVALREKANLAREESRTSPTEIIQFELDAIVEELELPPGGGMMQLSLATTSFNNLNQLIQVINQRLQHMVDYAAYKPAWDRAGQNITFSNGTTLKQNPSHFAGMGFVPVGEELRDNESVNYSMGVNIFGEPWTSHTIYIHNSVNRNEIIAQTVDYRTWPYVIEPQRILTPADISVEREKEYDQTRQFLVYLRWDFAGGEMPVEKSLFYTRYFEWLYHSAPNQISNLGAGDSGDFGDRQSASWLMANMARRYTSLGGGNIFTEIEGTAPAVKSIDSNQFIPGQFIPGHVR